MINHRKNRYISYLLLVPILGIHDTLQPKDAYLMAAIDAYIYAYPLVIADITKQIMINVVAPENKAGNANAPINQFAHVNAFPTPEFYDIVRPNVDTLYSVAWLDLSQEPIVLSVPDTHGRYYLMPLLDAWTNVFASLGARTTGTKAQDFVIVGPQWRGTVPKKMTIIHAPTNTVWILGRTQTNGKKDYASVHAIQKGYKLAPLSSFGRPYTAPKGRFDPSIDMKTAPVDQVARMDAQQFFELFANLLIKHPPPQADHAMLESLQKIGIQQGKKFKFAALPKTLQKTLATAIDRARQKMQQEIINLGQRVNGWGIMRTNIGSYGTDYLTRAVVALVGIGANLPEDAIYPTIFVDAANKPLDGTHNYRIHFDKNQIPPVHAFWSVTMYNAHSFLVPNVINRYALGDRDALHFNKDGSLDLYIQHTMPTKAHQANWLPAPQGRFNLTMRLYWPEQAVLNGTWMPPAIQKQ